jgi:hypothetical protein
MASWIVHFRIAETLLGQIPGLEAEKFTLGSVAPDSGKPDEKWEHFTPPTQVTHFQDPSGPPHDCRDLEFFRAYLSPLRPSPDPLALSFRLGYFFHLVTDNLWSQKIGRPTGKRWAAEFAANRDFIWEVKKDWYGLDFVHVRDHRECIFWRVFRGARPWSGGLDFLVPDSLAWSVGHIQKYYTDEDEMQRALAGRPCKYLSQEDVDRFVDESSEALIRIYNHLWLDENATGEHVSALELV